MNLNTGTVAADASSRRIPDHFHESSRPASHDQDGLICRCLIYHRPDDIGHIWPSVVNGDPLNMCYHALRGCQAITIRCRPLLIVD